MKMDAKKLSYSILILLHYTIFVSGEDPTVQLNGATIKGLKASDGNYNMYMGIPFAKVNESNIFGPSIPYVLNDTFEAYDDTIMCPQLNQYENVIMGTLDCLRLNIYVPISENASQTFPVMLWIYGGQFIRGFGGRYIYGPSYLVQHDVILVTMNYRTGPYGFFCLDMPEISGNQGLKDQFTAIKWVKENINAFGGDPDQITLFGESAGGHAVDFHLISTQETLYNKVILQTGSAQSLTNLYEPDKLAPIKMAKYIGFETDDTKEALEYLANTDTNVVMGAALDLSILFKPCVETVFDNVEPFITTSWIDVKTPKVKDMPVMMGFNKLEMAGSMYSRNAAYYNNSTIVLDTVEQIFNITDQKVNETKDMISRFYFGGEDMSEAVKWGTIRFASDITYIHPVHRTLQSYLDSGAGNIYFYMFSYVGGRNVLNVSNYDEVDASGTACCASHADDLGYLFDMQTRGALTDGDTIMMERMTTMWTNFAKYSNPTPEVNDVIPIIWEPVSGNKYNYLNIDTVFTMGKRPLHERMAFWDLFYTHNKEAQKEYTSQNYYYYLLQNV